MRTRNQAEVALSNAYRIVFGVDGGARNREQMLVVADLERFCSAHKPIFGADAREDALRNGRREVWLRINDSLRLKNPTVDDLLSAESPDEGQADGYDISV